MIKISANGAQAQKELSTLETKVKDFGKSMQSIGASMTKYVTVPLTALAGLSVKAANTQLQAEARLLTALKNRQDVQQRLIAQAQEIQSRTTYGDEAIIKQQAYLAALGLTEEQIRDTIEASVQLSAALGIELESAVRNLAKTYSGMTGELGESMPALKALTEEQLKSGEAIRLVNQEYKGFAEAAASTGAGSLEQLKNKFGDLAEKIGTSLLPIVAKLAEWLGKLVDWFNSMSPTMQEIIATMITFGIAVGPVFTVIGSLVNVFTSLKAVIPQVGQALTFLASNPAAMAVAAIGTLVAAFTSANSAAKRLKDTINDTSYQDQLIDEKYHEAYADYSQAKYGDIDLEYWRYYHKEAIENAETDFIAELNRASLRAINDVLKDRQNEGVLEKLYRELSYYEYSMTHTKHAGDISYYKDKADETRKKIDALVNGASELKEETEQTVGIIGKLQEEIARLREQMPFLQTAEEIAAANDQISKLNEQLDYYNNLSNKVEPVVTPVTPKINYSETMSLAPISWGVSGVKDLGIIDMLSSYDADKWREQMIAKAQKMADVVNEMNSIISAALANMVSGIGNYLEALISGDEFKPLVALLSMIGETLKQLGSALVAYAVSLEAFKKAFSNPWAALAAGAAAIVAGSAVMGWAKRMEKTTKLATGGLAYGPTMAIVGDNPGASNDPEVIAPLSKLRDYMGAQRLQLIGDVTFEIAGDTMRAVLNRENVRLSTLG